MSIDPQSFTNLTPAEFAAFVKSVSDADVREYFAGEHRVATLDGIFERFPSLFQPAKAQGVDARVNWRITGGPGDSSDTYAVVVKDGACTVEKAPTAEPNTSIMCGPVEFLKLLTGTGNPVMMVMSGKVKARGDVALAMAFQNWFDAPKA